MTTPDSIDTNDRYKWTALSNTTLGMFMAALDSSIVLISLPAIFRGINLDPLQPSNISYLLWMLMGYLVVTAVLVVSFGRLGDMFGRVRMYNAGFLVFTLASIALSLTPGHGGSAAMWLIGWRVVQGVGGALLMANSTAILTDAFKVDERGMAMGINMVAAIAGSFIGLIAGGLLAEVHWRLVFWVNVPFGIFGTAWAYLKLRETGVRRRAKLDIAGNLTFAAGMVSILIGITYGLQPHGGHDMGWTGPWVLTELIGGVVLLIAFWLIENNVDEPMFNLKLFHIRAFSAGNLASLLMSIGRGGLQFMLIIWLQGIWLPLHGYNFADTPLWAGIFMLPLDRGLPHRRPCGGLVVGSVRSPAVRDGWRVAVGDQFRAAHVATGRFLISSFRSAAADERFGRGNVRRPQHHGHHEQRSQQPARCRLRHARHVPEHRDGAVDRSVLFVDGRRLVVHLADLDVIGLDCQRGSGGHCSADCRCSAGGQPLCSVPWIQPDGKAGARRHARQADTATVSNHHGQAVLSEADLGTVHRRAPHRVHRIVDHVPDRRGRVVDARQEVRARRRRRSA